MAYDDSEEEKEEPGAGGGGGGSGGMGSIFHNRDLLAGDKLARANYFKLRFARSGYLKDVKSGRPQAVVKIIAAAEGYEARRMMLYIARERGKDIEQGVDGVVLTDQDGEDVKGREAVIARYKEWSQDFISRDLADGRKNRHVRHMLLSIKSANDPKTLRQLEAAGREFLQGHLGDQGFDYLMAVHAADKDNGHPHIHVIIKNANTVTQKPLDMSKNDLFYLRSKLAESLQEHGISSIATGRQDHLMKEIIQGLEPLRARDTRLKTLRDKIGLAQCEGELRSCRAQELDLRKSLTGALDYELKRIEHVAWRPIQKRDTRRELRRMRQEIEGVSRNQLVTYLKVSMANIEATDYEVRSAISEKIQEVRDLEKKIIETTKGTELPGLEKEAAGHRLAIEQQKARAHQAIRSIDNAIEEVETLFGEKDQRKERCELLTELRGFKRDAQITGGLRVKRGHAHEISIDY